MNEKIVAIQKILFPDTPSEWDGIWGPKSAAALEAAVHPPIEGWHSVKASSFADPADVRAFKRCKERGGSDQECFKYGDNAIGRWGDPTHEGTGPSVALPPEDWEPFADAHMKKVEVKYAEKIVVALLKDTMPHKRNIKNGAGIDMNPDTCRALGLEPPVMVKAQWRWA